MPHQFIRADEACLEGVWRTNNGRRFCAWRFECDSGTLKTSRGEAVRSTTLKPKVQSVDALKEMLPQLALDMANGDASEAA